MAETNLALDSIKEKTGTLNDHHPILLFPYRLETRFMTVKHVTDAFSHESVINTSDPGIFVKNMAFINDFINNGPADLAGALVPGAIVEKSHEHYEQTALPFMPDQKELWIRIFPDEISIYTHEKELTDDELDAGKSFWTAFFDAHHPEDSVIVGMTSDEIEHMVRNNKLGAWKGLVSSYGTARALWIKQATTPQNESFPESAPVFPEDIGHREFSWNNQPYTPVVPDQFVAVGMRTNGEQVFSVGNEVKFDEDGRLYVGIDPNENQEGAFKEEPSGLKMPQNIKWLTDFDTAFEYGMAIRMGLEDADFDEGFEKLIVIGIKTGMNGEASQATINDLFTNHLYGPGGMSIVAPGTPSNNTKDAVSGPHLDDLSAEESFELYFEQKDISHTPIHEEKCDGQRLSEALGLSADITRSTLCGDGHTISHAIWMNHLLSPATMGYALPQYLLPKVSKEELEQTILFMEDYVVGRGLLPTIRIDEQPYAIIPSTAFSALDFDVGKPEEAFLGRLYHNALKKLEQEWDTLKEGLRAINKKVPAEEVSELLFKILEQHAGSLEYFQRLAVDNQTLDIFKTINKDAGPAAGGEDINLNIQSPGAVLQQLEKFGFEYDESSDDNNYDVADDRRLLGFTINYADTYEELLGPIVDSSPLPEEDLLKILEENGKNYANWLGDVKTTFRDVLEETPYTSSTGAVKPPRALLYILLRHALLRRYLLTAININFTGNKTMSAIAAMDFPLNMTWFAPDIQILNDGLELTEEQKRRFQQQRNFQTTFLHLIQQELGEANVNQAVLDRANSLIRENKGLFVSNDRFALLSDYEHNGTSTEAFLDQEVDQPVPSDLDLYEQLNSNENGAVAQLRLQKRYLEKIAQLPVAELERCFYSHLDTCHYRLDAWLLGIIAKRLFDLRNKPADANGPGNQSYIGGYGYLEHVQKQSEAIAIRKVDDWSLVESEPRILPVVQLTALQGDVSRLNNILDGTFVYLGGTPIPSINEDPAGVYVPQFYYDYLSDSIQLTPVPQAGNQGFIPSPSLTHAITGALLRNGYLSHRKFESPEESFAVDLTAERVREALFFLEGIRNGQSLAALLGYKFERMLTDSANFAAALILDFRQKYEFDVQPIGATADDTIPDKAWNVVDGLKLVEDLADGELDFVGINFLDGHEEAQKEDVRIAVAHLDNILDAVKDLLFAEGIYQLALENPDRSRAALKAMNDVGNIQMPDIVNIPREGIPLTHRVGVQLPKTGRIQLWPGPATARSLVEPRINQWLISKLPNPNQVILKVRWIDHQDENGEPVHRTDRFRLSQLMLEPIDLVYMAYIQKDNPADSELRYRVDAHIRSKFDLREDQVVELLENDRDDFSEDEITWYALEPLCIALAEILLNARPVQPEDVLLPNDPAALATEDFLHPDQMKQRIERVLRPMSSKQNELESALSIIEEQFLPLSAALLEQQKGEALRKMRLVHRALMFFVSLGWQDALPARDYSVHTFNLNALYQQGRSVLKKSRRQLDLMKSRLNDYNQQRNKLSNPEKVELLKEVASFAFEKYFKVFPEYRIPNKEDYKKAYQYKDLLNYEGGEGFKLDAWMQSLVPVRPKLATYQRMLILSELLATDGEPKAGLKPIQFPFLDDGQDRWLAVEFPDYYYDFDDNNTRRMPEDNLALSFEYHHDFIPGNKMAGFIIDEWTERIPEKEVTIGNAFHYNKPNSEPPNALLLAVSPNLTGAWEWEHLLNTVIETVELAKKRLVTPEQISDHALSQFLPAIIPAVNLLNHTPSTDMGRNMADVKAGTFGVVEKQFLVDPLNELDDAAFDVSTLGIEHILDGE